MLRAEYCICGTSSTGTGTLTLAACPVPPGGTDLFQAFNVQALGTAVAIPISYTIVEYTDTTFRTASKQEKGVGSLMLGASIGATTLARTTVQQTSTGMETATQTYNTAGPSAVSLSSAVNTLVFIGASASDLLACSPYFDKTLTSSDKFGALPVTAAAITSTLSLTAYDIRSDSDNYHMFEWRVPMLAKRVRVNVRTTASGTSRLYGRLYAIGVDARPTKLLYDFGTFVGANILGSLGTKQTSATGSGFYMHAGEYFLDLMPTFASGQSPQLGALPTPYCTGRLGWGSGFGAVLRLTATSGSTLAGDPANVTSIDIAGNEQVFCFFSTT